MKVQSANPSSAHQKQAFVARLSDHRQRENLPLVFAVLLAFAFVGSCVFTLG